MGVEEVDNCDDGGSDDEWLLLACEADQKQSDPGMGRATDLRDNQQHQAAAKKKTRTRVN